MNEVTTASYSSGAGASGTAAQRYHQLMVDRTHFIDRADRCAKLTIPTLFQKDTQGTQNATIKDPHQSLGARGTNTLASKMLLSLLPMNTPFFKLNVDALELKQQGRGDLQTEIEKGLGVIERSVLRSIEESGDVTVFFEALKHLIVTGNVLVFVGKDGSRLYDLNKYVVSRAPNGNVIEIVVCEQVSHNELDDDQKTLVTTDQTKDGASASKTIPVYTHIRFEGGRVKWHQEIEGNKVPGSESDVPEKGNPWLALRFMRVDGESYGRGYVEMYLGDLDSLEVLTKAVRDAAISASKVVWLVRPNGTTSPKVLASAPNNSVRSGDANDVTTLRLDKGADLRVATDMLTTMQQRLAYAFMINAEVLRDAERVTAEEVRFVAQELDDGLGGIYSILSKDFQLPYVKRRLHLLMAEGKMPELPDVVSPVIVTGFAALGRGHDREKLIRFAKTLAEIYGPQALVQFINPDELNARLAVADGIDTNGLIVTEQEREKKQAQGQAGNMVEKLGPELIRQLGPSIQQQTGGAPDGSSQQDPSDQGG